MNNLLEQAKRWWDERSFGQKFSLLFLIVALVGILTYLFALSNQPDWDVLYDDLASTDAAAVASHLKDAGIVYRVTNGGKTILVSKGLVEETRLGVAEKDIIQQDDVGLEELSKMPIGLTENQQKLMRQRMLQGELVRTITKIKGVKDARVTIAEPERSIFASDDEVPSASVMLILDPGVKVREEQIKAIKNLVSHAIARLEPENVFVSDQNGKALSEEVTSSTSSIGDLRHLYEQDIEKKVKDVLTKLVGNDNVTVAVTAEMNFDRTTSKIERYIPTTQTEAGAASGVLVSEQVMGEKYSGQDSKAPGGTPGTASNITNPSYVTNAAGAGAKSSDYDKNSTTKNYEVSKEIKDILYAPGELERLTVAVAVNKVLTSKEQQTIEKLVNTAAGADMARGDIITVTGMSFASMEDLEEKTAALQKQAQVDYYLTLFEKFAPYLLIIVFGGAALFIFSSLLKRTATVEQFAEEEPLYDYPDTPDLLEAASIPVIEAKLDPEIERMRSEINAFVMNDPAEAARLLLTYIKE